MDLPTKSSWLTALLLCWAALGSSCASQHVYKSIEPGRFDGSLNLRWIAPEKFVFVPDPDNPFKFTRSNGEVIQPGAMFTDGGSMPQLLQSHPEFSSTGYAPAYVIHDWLHLEYSRKLHQGESVDIKTSALILAEGIKTLMEQDNSIRRKPLALNCIYRTMESPFAKYAAYIHPWHSDLPSPEKVGKMGARFYSSETPGARTPAADIIEEKTNPAAVARFFFPPLPHLIINKNKAEKQQE